MACKDKLLAKYASLKILTSFSCLVALNFFCEGISLSKFLLIGKESLVLVLMKKNGSIYFLHNISPYHSTQFECLELHYLQECVILVEVVFCGFSGPGCAKASLILRTH